MVLKKAHETGLPIGSYQLFILYNTEGNLSSHPYCHTYIVLSFSFTASSSAFNSSTCAFPISYYSTSIPV